MNAVSMFSEVSTQDPQQVGSPRLSKTSFPASSVVLESVGSGLIPIAGLVLSSYISLWQWPKQYEGTGTWTTL